jgi:isoleucyl-tRNA synthetase
MLKHTPVSESLASSPESLSLTGLFAKKEGARKVLEIIKDQGDSNSLLLVAHKFTHESSIDWRTKQSVITRATAQWFADVSLFKDVLNAHRPCILTFVSDCRHSRGR